MLFWVVGSLRSSYEQRGDLEGLEFAPPLTADENGKFVVDSKAQLAQARAGVEIIKASDVNDAAILATMLTRRGNAINIDGTPATTSDKLFAAGGAIITFCQWKCS